MIVCHCNCIHHSEIEEASTRLLADDPWRLLTPAAVYKALGQRPRCGGCLPLAANLIHTRACRPTPGCHRCPLAAQFVDASVAASIGVVSDEVGGEVCTVTASALLIAAE